MKTVGEMIDYLSEFPRDWELVVCGSDEGGYLVPYLEGRDFLNQTKDMICLKTEDRRETE
jgi:hypothetical protein